MYNYNPRNLEEFHGNANVITQYNDINDYDYYDYYHSVALLLAVQIDQNQVKDFEDYIYYSTINISYQEAIEYIHNKIRGEQNEN